MTTIAEYKHQPDLACCCNCNHVHADYEGLFECQNPDVMIETPGDLARWVDPIGVCPRFKVME